MSTVRSESQRLEAPARQRERPRADATRGVDALHDLQHTAGNRAVARMIRRAKGDGAAAGAGPAGDPLPPGAVQDPNDPNLFHVDTYETLKVAGRKKARRTDEQGPVRITLQRVPTRLGPMIRPIRVEGKIVPTVTSGRGGAPDAISGIKTGTAKATHEDRESIMDAHRGHLMALELGGPDLPENIVPQWAMFQSNGVWRQAEMAALRAAEDAATRGFDCMFTLEVKYLENASGQLPSRRRLGTPKGFTMSTQNVPSAGSDNDEAEDAVVHFDDEQDRDATDWRQIDQLLTGRKAKKPTKAKGRGKAGVTKRAAAAKPAQAGSAAGGVSSGTPASGRTTRSSARAAAAASSSSSSGSS